MELIVNGIKINCLLKKNGDKKIIFLHGWQGSTDSFIGVADRLCGYEMLLIDMPPFGKSSQLNRPFCIDDYSEILKQITERFQYDKFSIVAHSFGCRIALKFAAKYPEKVEKMVLTGAAGLRPKRTLKYRINVLKYKLTKKMVDKGFLKRERLNKFGSKDYKALSDDMKKTFTKIVNEDLSGELKKIMCPVILYFGRNDKETPLYMARKMEKNIDDCALITVEGGHFAYITHINAFSRIISEFI